MRLVCLSRVQRNRVLIFRTASCCTPRTSSRDVHQDILIYQPFYALG